MTPFGAHTISESGLLPDSLIRAGIRHRLKQRIEDIAADDIERAAQAEQDFLQVMREGAIAEVPGLANAQHYELPAKFFERVLGRALKYSCGRWPEGVRSLDEAEDAALAETCEHAQLADGQRILELGCGWGSLTLYMAQRHPNSRITAVSNSRTQGDFIRARAAGLGLHNLEVLTSDMNEFDPDGTFDRVVSIEMFEHMRNWERLFARVNSWLNPNGRFLMHVFVHATTPYLFKDERPTDWMSRHFFSGGMMPSATLPLRCLSPLVLQQRWFWSGLDYARTCEAWLRNMDRNRESLNPLFERTYGGDFAPVWWQRWRMFFLACAELFAYRGGREWFVGQYLFGKVRG